MNQKRYWLRGAVVGGILGAIIYSICIIIMTIYLIELDGGMSDLSFFFGFIGLFWYSNDYLLLFISVAMLGGIVAGLIYGKIKRK